MDGQQQMIDRYAPNMAERRVLEQITIPFNRCNLPAWLLASVSYQQQPVPLLLDSVSTWYQPLFTELAAIAEPTAQAEHFNAFMAQRFGLHRAEPEPPPRPKLHYRRMLLGWLFDSDSHQGAAWRAWVESRFGLLTQFYQQPLAAPDSRSYQHYRHQSHLATYNTNELFEQLDLLYHFCQLQLQQHFADIADAELSQLTLYRGCRKLPNVCVAGALSAETVLLNNLSSFALSADIAAQFGDCVYAIEVPLSKIVSFSSLLPNMMTGEQEFMVLGGLYQAQLLRC